LDTYIEYLDLHVPAKTIAISDVLGNEHLTEEQLEKISLRLLGTIEPKATLINHLEPMSTMFFGDRRQEGEVYESMVERMFASGVVHREEVSHVIYTRGDSIAVGDPWSIHSDKECVNVPYFVQQRTRMQIAVVFNVEQECTGSFTAMNISTALLQQGQATNVLILSSNFFGMSHKRLMGGSIFVGDGQGLILVGKDRGPFQLVDATGYTDGAINSVNSFLDFSNQQRVIDIGVYVIRELLERNRLRVDEISLVVPLNTSQFPWIKYTKALGIPMHKVFVDNIGKGGHMGDVDLVRNLRDVSANRKGAEGYVVAYGVSTGTSWNALLLRRNHN
jgi:hypothetical protein